MNTIGAIVVSYLDQELLVDLVISLQEQCSRVVVVANAPLEVTLPDGVDVLEQKRNLGYGKVVNIGAAHCITEGCTALLVINPDTQIEDTLVAKLAAGLQEHGADIVQPVVCCPDGKVNTAGNVLTYYGISYCPDFGAKAGPQQDQEITVVSGACFLVTRTAWERLQGFAEDFFMYQEDTDLSWRAQLFSMKMMCIAHAQCVHQYELRLPKWKLYYLERNRIQMVLQNYRLGTLLFMLPFWIYLELGMLGYAFTQGWGHLKLKGYGAIVLRLPRIFWRRGRISREVSDGEILKHMVSTVKEPGLGGMVRKIFLDIPAQIWGMIMKKVIN